MVKTAYELEVERLEQILEKHRFELERLGCVINGTGVSRQGGRNKGFGLRIAIPPTLTGDSRGKLRLAIRQLLKKENVTFWLYAPLKSEALVEA